MHFHRFGALVITGGKYIFTQSVLDNKTVFCVYLDFVFISETLQYEIHTKPEQILFPGTVSVNELLL